VAKHGGEKKRKWSKSQSSEVIWMVKRRKKHLKAKWSRRARFIAQSSKKKLKSKTSVRGAS